MLWRDTHAGKSGAAVTTFGGSGELFQVVVDQLAAGGLDDTPPGGGGVVRRALAEGDSLGHSVTKVVR